MNLFSSNSHFNNQYWEGLFRAQDGAPVHRLVQVRGSLNEVFGNNCVVGLRHDVEWPPRSLDLTPCDFFMWGYLKDKVLWTPPQNMENLRQKLIEQFNALREQPVITRKAVRDMHKLRTVVCVERNGGHVEGHGA
jgi:uncharacterized protein (UPF0248 family)